MRGAASLSIPTTGVVLAGRYRVGHVIGQGGMGVVLEAWDQKAGVAVAVKVLQAEGRESAGRFFREARLVSQLASEHIVRVIDFGTFQGRPFMVMDRLVGEDFGAKVRERRLALEEVADCIVQACEALAHAHRAGIVHRDIKASNLFEHTRPRGSIVKVLDFGISKAVAGGANEPERTMTRTRDGAFLGSPPYMSPEQIRSPRTVDARTDIWSLGVVAYRLLSAQYPFHGESTGELLLAIVESPAPRLRDLGHDVPIEVDAVVARCLARSRDERFPDVGALAVALAPFASPRWRSYGEHVQAVGRAPPIAPSSAPSSPPPAPSSASPQRPWPRVVGSAEPGTETATPIPSAPIGEADTVIDKPDPLRPSMPYAGRQDADPGTLPLPPDPRSLTPSSSRDRNVRPRTLTAIVVAACAVAAIGGGVWFTTRRAEGPAATVASAEEPRRSVPSAVPAAAPAALAPSAPSSALETSSPPRAAPSVPPVRPGRTRPGTRMSPAAGAPAASTPAPTHAHELEPNPYTE